MNQITAVVIWKNGHFVGKCITPTVLNSNLFTEGPKPAWLSSASYCCGGDEAYKLTFSMPNDINALSGVYLAVGKEGYFIDGAEADVLTKINGCCGDGAAVTPIYNGNFPAIITPVAKTYTITRLDNGLLMDTERFLVAYSKWIIDGSWTKTSSDGTTSVYVFTSYSDPIPQGGDTIVETPRVFTSAVAPTLTGSNVFTANIVADGVTSAVKGATTLAGTVTILNADAGAKLLGTWTNDSTHLILTTTSVDRATITIGQQAP